MKIGIFTLSSPAGFWFPNRAKRVIDFLESKGNEVVLGNLFDKKDGYRSGTIKQRVNEINELIKEPLDLLLSAIGGQDTNSILPYIDYKLLNRNVKAICGFSDTSSILSAVVNKCPNVKVIYGPSAFSNFGEFEKESAEFSYKSLLEALNGKKHEIMKSDFYYSNEKNWEFYQEPRTTKSLEWKTINNENVETITGVVKGGNLSTLMSVWNTEYGPTFNKGDILFTEVTDKSAANIERYFSLLKLSGVFDKVSAVIFGTLHNYDDQGTKYKPIDILEEVINNPKLPILYDVNISHDKPMAALELNVKTIIDFKNKEIIQ